MSERIREVVGREVAGPQGHAILASIAQANPERTRLHVNDRYPPGIPRATMPAPILTKLPMLPEELEYRFLGQSLVLIDTRANLVVDVLPDVLPVSRP